MLDSFRNLWNRAVDPPIPQPRGLIGVLLDRTAPLGDRGDAALGLGKFDEIEVEAALLEIARDAGAEEDLAEDCGTSLGAIWSRRAQFDAHVLASLHPAARSLAVGELLGRRPELRSAVESV